MCALAVAPTGMLTPAAMIATHSSRYAMKHARGAALSIAVRRTGSDVELEVLNGAGTPEDEPTGARHGLVGMRERAALFGGRVDARPTGDGGFQVVATLPLAPA